MLNAKSCLERGQQASFDEGRIRADESYPGGGEQQRGESLGASLAVEVLEQQRQHLAKHAKNGTMRCRPHVGHRASYNLAIHQVARFFEQLLGHDDLRACSGAGVGSRSGADAARSIGLS